jgi:peptide/nickel transport system substrate-binding protein
LDDIKRTLHRFRLKTRRKLRKQRRQVEDITAQADDSLNKLVFKRIERLYKVRRFVSAWTLLVFLIGVGAVWQVRGLDQYYLQSQPTDGGTYREGLIGTFTTADPLFAVSGADAAVARLVFQGLFTLAPTGELEPSLASGISVDEKRLKYTVELRTDVMWHDGEQFTAADVVYTYKTIQNKDTRSPLRSSWLGVDIESTDEYTVTFTLPNTLSSFEYSLINGIVPEHILGSQSPENLRSSVFNSINPVGTGPFTYEGVEVIGTDVQDRQEKITLKKFDTYFATKPLLDSVVIRTYRLEESMLSAFEQGEINAMVGLDTLPDYLNGIEKLQTFSTPVTSAVMLFFNTSAENLKEQKVRQALVHATDTDGLRQSIGYQLLKVNSPFLQSHFAYNPEKTQLPYDTEQAAKLLDETGWTLNADGKRAKGENLLRFRLVSQSLSEYATIVQSLQQQWSELGVTVDAVLLPEQDIQSGSIARHDYDILLYGISLGPDPDVFAFWHSSQADPRQKTRLNLSEYKSEIADEALEGGRTRLDEDLRTVKYGPFLDAWRTDAPAVALYQPRFLYVVRGTFEGYQSGQFNSSVDRFYSINNWKVRSEKTVR